MAVGVAIIAGFLRLERFVARRGGMPLIDLALLSDPAFMRGLVAVFFFFFANLSFYLIMTIFMQRGLQNFAAARRAGVRIPLALTFVIASKHSGARAEHRGTLVLIQGCAVQIIGLAALVTTIELMAAPSAIVLALVLMVFGYGQGLVMAPLSSAVLSTVKPASAGAGSGMYGTTAQIANATGVAAMAVSRWRRPVRRNWRSIAACALFALSIIVCAVFLSWMRRAAA